MRPMFFDFPDDDICYSLKDQYMFGRDILFAPILVQNSTERQVYLPEGEWIRTTDGQLYSGDRWLTCHAEIDEFIAFVRNGAEVSECFKKCRGRFFNDNIFTILVIQPNIRI